MAFYSMGKLAKPEEVEALKGKRRASKNSCLPDSRTTDWTELDIAIVRHLAAGETINGTAILLQMPIRHFHEVLGELRKLRRAKNNTQLVVMAMRAGVIE
jgi:hypothetical protein